jgi:hypothetical protein
MGAAEGTGIVQPRWSSARGIVDRKTLQKLAEIRLKDAAVLLARKRWSGAYYLVWIRD